MKIRRLEIQGFKSFADRTILTFGEGITGVVGPNGCGKSNIVDAIRWAMGEQSAKHLRGQGMQDIIFAGSESRGPLGVAEVTITFKNDGSLVPPEFQKFEEISVTRRLFRDGTSEYAINKVVCRLRDILDLFMGTGIGKQAYSIIEQGRIGLIVTAKPEDRRSFIEEAAGISRYKARRKQAERRIEATEQNLLRITDITNELKSRIGSLERQAKKAEKYKRLKGELKELDLCAAAHRWFELDALERFAGTQAAAVREQIGADEDAIDSEELRIGEALEGLAEREQDLRARESRIHEHQQAAALAENNIDFHGRERVGQIERKAEAENEHVELETELVALRADRDAAEELGRELEATGGVESKVLVEKEQALAELEARITGSQAKLESDKDAMVEMLTTIAKHNNNIQNLERVDGDLETRLERAQVSLRSATDRLRGLEKETKEARHSLNENRQMKLALEDRRTAQESLIENLRGELIENETVLLGGRQELMDKRSRLNSLLEIRRNYEGCKEGVRSIMRKKDEDPAFSHALHGLVADVVSSDPRYETAIEAVLGDRLQYVIVGNQADGIASIEDLKERADGRGSFIPLDLREDHVSWAPRAVSNVPAPAGLGSGATVATQAWALHPIAAAQAVAREVGERRLELDGWTMVAPDPVAAAEKWASEIIGANEAGDRAAETPVGSDSASEGRISSEPPPPWSAMPVVSDAPKSPSEPPPPWSALPAPSEAPSMIPAHAELSDAELWPDLRATGVCGKLIDLVRAQQGYEHVARVLLGDVVVVEEISHAQKLWRENGHRKTLVTLAGEVLDPVGVITGGTTEGVSAGMLAQKREINELTDQVRLLEARVKIAEERHATLKERITELDRAIKELSKDSHQGELSIVKIERDLRRLEEGCQRAAEERRQHEEEIASITEKRESIGREAEEAQHGIADLEGKKTAAELEVGERTLELNGLREAARVLQSETTELKITVAANSERSDGSKRNLARIVQRVADVEARLRRLAEIVAESEAETIRLAEKIEAAKLERIQLAQLLEEEKAELTLLRERVDVEGKELRDEEKEFKNRRKSIDALRDALNDAQMKMRECQLGRDALLQQIDERYRVSIPEILPDYHLVPPQTEEHHAQMEKLRSQIDNIGPINLTAIDEFNQINERYTFLSAQKEIEQAIGTLRAAIKKINHTSKDRYIEAFRLVNEKFQLVFPRLFNGGSASLVMMDESDPLESGIEMLAQPPGKKLQSVNLLSGGEKALTAVALIFSIFLIKPTPFCLLDEVDAPLDEANVGRYNEMVRDMSSVSQFILITHNKRTMELPDRLYGVTMEEPGTSKIVPVDIVGERRSKLKAV